MSQITDTEHVKTVINWGAAIALFILGLSIPIIILLTGTNGKWELSCFALVWGLAAIISIMHYGAIPTYHLYNNTSWIVKYPVYAAELPSHISHAQFIISNTYTIGLIASLVTALTLAQHTMLIQQNPVDFVTISIRPLIYALLFSEFWFRPYKKRMQTMLDSQNHPKL